MILNWFHVVFKLTEHWFYKVCNSHSKYHIFWIEPISQPGNETRYPTIQGDWIIFICLVQFAECELKREIKISDFNLNNESINLMIDTLKIPFRTKKNIVNPPSNRLTKFLKFFGFFMMSIINVMFLNKANPLVIFKILIISWKVHQICWRNLKVHWYHFTHVLEIVRTFYVTMNNFTFVSIFDISIFDIINIFTF